MSALHWLLLLVLWGSCLDLHIAFRPAVKGPRARFATYARLSSADAKPNVQKPEKKASAAAVAAAGVGVGTGAAGVVKTVGAVKTRPAKQKPLASTAAGVPRNVASIAVPSKKDARKSKTSRSTGASRLSSDEDFGTEHDADREQMVSVRACLLF